MSRITLEMSVTEAITKMSDGNPGAIMALASVALKNKKIDPYSAFGEFSSIISLDTYGIYGTEIYVLFNDKCGSDIRKFIMLLRATQMGFFDTRKVQNLAKDQCRSLEITDKEWEDIETSVLKDVPEFDRGENPSIQG
jgi:hypothetical protein